MSTIKVNTIQSNTTATLDVNSPIPSLDVTGSVSVGGDISASGIVTATSFSGNLTGNVNSTGVTTVTTLSATNIVGVSTLGVTTAYINTLSGISTINASAAVSINQNLVFASGTGIDFSADSNAAGMTSELLDDYEEGSWTPDLGGITGETYSGQEGYYVKIGTLCLASGRISLSNKGSASSEITISLPFAKGSTDGRRVVANIQWENMTTAVSNVYGLIYLSQAISVYRSSTTTTSSAFLYHAELANNTVLHFSVVYHTA